MNLRLPPLALALTAAVVFAGCGGGEAASTEPPAAPSGQTNAGTQAPSEGKGSVVTVKTFNFQPDPIEIEAGDTVTWTNMDSAVHTATSGTRSKPDGDFDLELTESGGTAEHTFDEPGTYSYFCDLHSGAGMTGKVIVR